MQPALNPHAASTLHPMMATPVSALLWLMVASSSFVFIEPAPCDLLAVVLTAVALASGLRFPMGLGAPALLATLFLVANILSIITASPNSLAPVHTSRSILRSPFTCSCCGACSPPSWRPTRAGR